MTWEKLDYILASIVVALIVFAALTLPGWAVSILASSLVVGAVCWISAVWWRRA